MEDGVHGLRDRHLDPAAARERGDRRRRGDALDDAAAVAQQRRERRALAELDAALAPQLTSYPVKGALDPVIPTDPLLYRFYEILQVYGLPLKDVIQEKFGDGIMSAIDFTLQVDKVEDPKGDRVKVTMNGKFLPYKTW